MAAIIVKADVDAKIFHGGFRFECALSKPFVRAVPYKDVAIVMRVALKSCLCANVRVGVQMCDSINKLFVQVIFHCVVSFVLIVVRVQMNVNAVVFVQYVVCVKNYYVEVFFY